MTISPTIRLVVYVLALYATFVSWGYIQEKLTSISYVNESTNQSHKWKFPCVLNMCLATTCFLVAQLAHLLFDSQGGSTVPFTKFFRAAFTCAMASPIGYAALKYISFPLLLLTKSAKPVPVMLVGMILYGQTYTWYKYLSVLFISGGIAIFTLAKQTTQSSNTPLILQFVGICMVILNLFLDGYTNNDQDRIFKQYKVSSTQMMKFINLWQVIFLLSFLMASHVYFGESSELAQAVPLILGSPDLRLDLIIFCLCGALGQLVIFAMMKEFGSLVWITVSVTRKMFTILFSVFMFHHALKPIQWGGIALVFMGMTLEVVMGYQSEQAKKRLLQEQSQQQTVEKKEK